MGATMSKKVHVLEVSISNLSKKTNEPSEMKNRVFTWNERILMWKDSESRLRHL